MPYVLNVTLNAAGELVTATFGDTQAAFRRAVEYARAIYGVPVPRDLDIVVAGSHPCDIEFWQAHKSLYPAAMVVRPGGTIIVVTPCPEGVTATHADLLNYAAEPADRIIGRYESGETDGENKGREPVHLGTVGPLLRSWGAPMVSRVST